MVEYYGDEDQEVRVVEIQERGPPYCYKGLPRAYIDSHPELAWMLKREQKHVQTFGSEEGEFVWVLGESWDRWRAAPVRALFD